MLSPDYLKALGARIEAMYAELEDDLIADIARRIVSTKFQITQSAVWQAEVLEQIGVLRKDILRRVSRATDENVKVITDLFEEGGMETLKYDDAVYKAAGLNPLPIRQSPAMLQIITASAKKCNNELTNLTRTTAATASATFRQICDKAYMQVISGGFDYNTAIRNAVKAAGKAGVKVVYPKGGTAQLDVACRRAIITGVNQTAGQIQIMRMDEMGAELVETSAHFGARPDHAEWQGQVFYYKEPVRGYDSFIDATGYGTGDGLMGWNCRHSFFPYIEGISTRAYTDDELREMKEHTVEYNGKEYTDYKASQIQRGMERDIRATKREIISLDASRKAKNITPEEKAELTEEYNKTSVMLAQKNEKLADFLKQTGRGEDRARLMVDGFDRSHAQASVWAARKNGFVKKDIDKSVKSDIIKSRSVNEIMKTDENIHKSLGAAGKNYPVKLPDGNHAKFAEGTKITNIKVFAGKDTDVPIRDAIYLENTYGINADKWQKVRGEGTVMNDGKPCKAEIHWYEAEGQKEKIKVKRWIENES